MGQFPVDLWIVASNQEWCNVEEHSGMKLLGMETYSQR